MQKYIQQEIKKSISVFSEILANAELMKTAELISKKCINALNAGKKIIFCGNGGSAADSQHLAAELVSRLCYDRPALAAIALTTDTSALTAIGNDYCFENLFSRQVEALGCGGDVLIGISTSGKSPNILKALKVAKTKGLATVGLTGKNIQLMSEHCDLVFGVPSIETPKIQESHIMMGHIICALMEEEIFGEAYNPKRKATVIA